ncbi:MAG: hypothetical protein F4Y49_02995 [Dehalococcoidia bacterium]|nr:hypothetical protein [Dehalococcoidia bacterium]
MTTKAEVEVIEGFRQDVVVYKSGKMIHIIEVESANTNLSAEASSQWVNYAEAFNNWHLVVLYGEVETAKKLLEDNEIENCTVSSWWLPKGSQNLSSIQFTTGLPGLS